MLGLLAGLVLLAVVLVTQSADRVNTWASVLGTGVTIAGLFVTLVTWWLRQRTATTQPATSDRVTQAAQELQAAVREQWRKEAEARSLGDPDPMPVRWRLSEPEMMDHDDHIASAQLRFSGWSDRIVALTDQFRKLRRHRLVIIGGPGSGKTTLAVQLLLQLLEGWQPGEPIPVLFSLASWDPHTQPRVHDWLATQLILTYPNLRAFGPDTAQRLANQGQLLPVLDGLDEIPTDRRGEVIEALNASLHSDTGLILTSRTTEYTETMRTWDVLTAAAVIEPEPLTASEAARYLEGLLPRRPGDSWQAVLTALRAGTAGTLAVVVASPLGLWLLRTVYIDGRRDPQPLIDPTRYPEAATIQYHLLDELIPVTVRSRLPLLSGQDSLRPKRRYDPDQLRRWLTTLAIELRDAQTRDWRWWQLALHTFTVRQAGLVFGLVFGVMSGLMFGLLIGLRYDPIEGLMSGLLFGLVIGLPCGSFGGLIARACDAPSHIDFRLRSCITEFSSRQPADKLMVGLMAGVLAWVTYAALPVGPLVALVFGLVFGLVIGLIGFMANPNSAQRASSPTESQRGDGRLTILVISMVGLLVGLGSGLFALMERPSELMTALGFGLFALVLWLPLGLVFGPLVTKTCWLSFVVVSLWMGVRRRLPFSLMRFLDDAYRLGLLRVVGPVYQFRHAALQDHLAPPAESQESAAIADPPAPQSSNKTKVQKLNLKKLKKEFTRREKTWRADFRNIKTLKTRVRFLAPR